jgi:hypothetical protein
MRAVGNVFKQTKCGLHGSEEVDIGILSCKAM